MQIQVSGEKTATLRTIFHSLASFTEHITVYVHTTGLHLQGMDGCHICLFDCKLDKAWFDSYAHDGDSASFTVVARVLANVVKMVMPDQIVTLSRNASDDKLAVAATGGDATCDKEFEIPLMTVDHEIINLAPLLSLEPEAEICMTSKHLAELVSQFEMFDKVVAFRLSEDNVELSANGDAGSMTARLELEGGHLIEYAIEEGLEFTQAFCLKYVKLMTCFGPVASEVNLLFYDQKPMFMSYQLGTGSALTLMLAPRV